MPTTDPTKQANQIANAGTAKNMAKESTPEGQLAAKKGIFTNKTTGVTYNAKGEQVDANGKVVKDASGNAIVGSAASPKTTTTPTTTPPPTTPTTTPTTIPTTTTTPTKKDMSYPPAQEQFKDLIAQAQQAGINEKNLQGGIDAYNKGYMNQDQFQNWLNKVISPKDAEREAIDNSVGAETTTTPPTTSPDAVTEAEQGVEEAQSDYEKTMADLQGTLKESQDTLVASAEETYNAEMKNLNDAMALQEQLAAQQKALIESSSAIQKQEVKNAYDANLAAIELQKKKVAEAYEAMKEEQKLLNTQRKVREETALGLIYGGFGSLAANKNLEDTIVAGERELLGISKDAVNADTELQNKVVELNKSYELDLRKIEQWKSEETTKVYAQLSSYVQEIMADKNMAAVEKNASIKEAVTNYNTKVAEINATVAQTKLDLSLEILNRADQLKQQEFQNQITTAEETRAQETYEYEKNRTVINDARTDLDLMLTTYMDQDYTSLPADVLAQIKALEEKAKLPTGAAEQLMNAAKESKVKEGDIIKEFTNSVTGEVTAIKYNFDTGKVETIKLGALETPDKVWTGIGTDADGNVITLNEVTGEVKVQGQYSGQSGSPSDALSVPDDSYGGQCGHFVNQYTGLGMGDTYESKIDKMDPSITKPEAGMVFVMKSGTTGHTGFILSISADGLTATVKDSNFYTTSAPEIVKTHTIPVSQMTGFLNVSGKASGSSKNNSTTTTTPTTSTTTTPETTTEGSTGYTPLFTD